MSSTIGEMKQPLNAYVGSAKDVNSVIGPLTSRLMSGVSDSFVPLMGDARAKDEGDEYGTILGRNVRTAKAFTDGPVQYPSGVWGRQDCADFGPAHGASKSLNADGHVVTITDTNRDGSFGWAIPTAGILMDDRSPDLEGKVFGGHLSSGRFANSGPLTRTQWAPIGMSQKRQKARRPVVFTHGQPESPEQSWHRPSLGPCVRVEGWLAVRVIGPRSVDRGPPMTSMRRQLKKPDEAPARGRGGGGERNPQSCRGLAGRPEEARRRREKVLDSGRRGVPSWRHGPHTRFSDILDPPYQPDSARGRGCRLRPQAGVRGDTHRR